MGKCRFRLKLRSLLGDLRTVIPSTSQGCYEENNEENDKNVFCFELFGMFSALSFLKESDKDVINKFSWILISWAQQLQMALLKGQFKVFAKKEHKNLDWTTPLIRFPIAFAQQTNSTQYFIALEQIWFIYHPYIFHRTSPESIFLSRPSHHFHLFFKKKKTLGSMSPMLLGNKR